MARRTVRGFAWIAYPDTQPPDDRFHPDRPFGADAGVPPGVKDFWPIPTAFGLEDDQSGATDLVVTEAASRPQLHAGYKVAPAQVHEGYTIGGGLVRLVRIIGTRKTDAGAVRECEFEVDES